jgi:hypothetical protein
MPEDVAVRTGLFVDLKFGYPASVGELKTQKQQINRQI